MDTVGAIFHDHEGERLDRGLDKSCPETAQAACPPLYPTPTLVQCQQERGHPLPHRCILAGMTVEWQPVDAGLTPLDPNRRPIPVDPRFKRKR